MSLDKDLILNDHPEEFFDVESESVADAMLVEELAAFLGDDFPYNGNHNNNNDTSVVFTESATLTPIDHSNCFDCPTMSGEISNNVNTNTSMMGNGESSSLESRQHQDEIEGSNSRRPKKRRQPNQVQEHIIAERKRRELLTQQFIALSAIVPGLKKTDKVTVLGQTIKYLKQLKDKVKDLEEVAAKKQTVESVVLIRKSQLVVDNINDNNSSWYFDDDDDNNNNNSNSSSSNNNNNNNNCMNNCNNTANNSLPQIEVKVSGKNLLFKVYCEKKKGILPKLFFEMEKCGLAVLTTSMIPFGDLALDITILAQQVEMGLDENVMKTIRGLHSVFQP